MVVTIKTWHAGLVAGIMIIGGLAAPQIAQATPEDRQSLFGETHVHTSLSFDSFIFGNRNRPDDAYRFARGATIRHPAGFEMKLDSPLDFQAVTDHAMYLGMVPAMFDLNSSVAKHPLAVRLREAEGFRQLRDAFQDVIPYAVGIVENDDLVNVEVIRTAWQEVIDAAEKHNDPGKFTTFIGYEFTTSQNLFENLHRNVLFRGRKVPTLPLSRRETMNPEDLWKWMDKLRDDGIDSIAIPHNSNGSNGFMFRDSTFEGDPIDMAYSKMRMRNEPVVEMTQVKGTSDTHPFLSPNDEFADFEIMPYQVASWFPSRPKGSYVRDAYRNGLQFAAEGKGNPYKFGLIGASDTHVSAGGYDEYNYWSKIGNVDSNGMLRGSVKLDWKTRFLVWLSTTQTKISRMISTPVTDFGAPPKNMSPGYLQTATSTWGASGLAGVWAEKNTRDSIFNAFVRKEVFATSGPRIRVRLFAGYDYPRNMIKRSDMIKIAYARGVPMGGDLIARGKKAPDFLIWAVRDMRSQPLQRVQIIKGWIEGDKTFERVYDVACAGDAKPDPTSHRCPDNNDKVDLTNCKTSADSGADELMAQWRDPDFKPGVSAFYYVRALENSSCRWSTWDAIRAESPRNPALKATIQERVWSSPIWYDQ